jgi:hypothetical protein
MGNYNFHVSINASHEYLTLFPLLGVIVLQKIRSSSFLSRFLDFVGQYSIMIEWKEWDHEADDLSTMGDKKTLVAMLDYGLLNFFIC